MLSGDYKGCMEYHVENDLLLVWIDGDIINLVRIGNHSELFGNNRKKVNPWASWIKFRFGNRIKYDLHYHDNGKPVCRMNWWLDIILNLLFGCACLFIPGEGDTVKMDRAVLALYRKPIECEMGCRLSLRDSTVCLNDSAIFFYRFRKSYLFVVLLVVLLSVAARGGCLVSLAVFACFSYLLRIPASVSAWALVVAAALLVEWLAEMERKTVSGVLLVVAAAAVTWTAATAYGKHFGRLQAVREWMPVRVLYHSGTFKAAAEEYGGLYDGMSWHKDFCFEYGRALYRTGSYGKAEEVLFEVLKVNGDPMILNVLGRNAQEMGEYGKAEKYLLRSIRRLQERIYLHYLLVKLYALPEYNRPDRLGWAAIKVLFSVPKVQSSAIREMCREVTDILERHSITPEGADHEAENPQTMKEP